MFWQNIGLIPPYVLHCSPSCGNNGSYADRSLSMAYPGKKHVSIEKLNFFSFDSFKSWNVSCFWSGKTKIVQRFIFNVNNQTKANFIMKRRSHQFLCRSMRNLLKMLHCVRVHWTHLLFKINGPVSKNTSDVLNSCCLYPLFLLGGLSLHLNHLIASRTANYDWPFGTLPFGLFGSSLDTRDLETYPRTYSGHFWNMSVFDNSRAVWVLFRKWVVSENQSFLDEGVIVTPLLV